MKMVTMRTRRRGLASSTMEMVADLDRYAEPAAVLEELRECGSLWSTAVDEVLCTSPTSTRGLFPLGMV